MQTSFFYVRRLERGFTLLEIMVALLVLSFGLLGLAGLQAASIGSNHSAYLRSQATQLAYDMTDRMRANMTAVDVKDYHNPSPTKTLACESAGCSAQAMAQHDVFRWNEDIARLLPGGSGVVCIDSTPLTGSAVAVGCDGNGLQYVVKVWWLDDPQNPATTQQFLVSFRP